MRAVLTVAAVALATAALGARADPAIEPWKGKQTPALEGKRLDGGTLDLGAMRGRVVVVNFWATWCDPCKAEMPSLQRLRAKFADRPVEVLAINYGEFPAKIKSFLERERITLPILLDTQKEAATAWGVGGLPMTFLVDASGRARYQVYGERDWSDAESVGFVEKLVAEIPRAGH